MAAGTYTDMSGCIMEDDVLEANRFTSGELAMINEVQDKVGAKIAELCHAESAMVTAGCWSAIVLGTAGVLTGMDQYLMNGPSSVQADAFTFRSGVTAMVDFGSADPPLSPEDLLMKHLRPGDIFTHTYACFPDTREAVADENGKVKPFIFDAQKRGIKFDAGHGGGSFRWKQAIPSVKQGFIPDAISSDLHTGSMNSGMKDMANLMSKFLYMGLSLQDVILRSLWNPAKMINRPDLGNLTAGAEADVAIFSLSKGNFGFPDISGERINGTEKLTAELTIRAGKIVCDLNGMAAPEYK